LAKVSAEGGECEPLTVLDESRGEVSHRWPQVLPNGKAVLFVVSSDEGVYDESRIEVQSFVTGDRKLLTKATYARYAPTGHLLYVRGGMLYGEGFDADGLKVTGTAVIPLQPGVVATTRLGAGSAQFAISDTGTLVYVSIASIPVPNRPLVLVDLQGNEEALPAPSLPYESARFSPDGKRLALMTVQGEVGVYVLETGRLIPVLSEFTDDSGVDWSPLAAAEWDPGGMRLAVGATGGASSSAVFVVPVDRSTPPRPLFVERSQAFPNSWFPDGERLLVHELASQWRTLEVSLAAAGAPRVVSSSMLQPVLSRDGNWIAYFDYETGELYVRRYEGTGIGEVVSRDGGVAPSWAPDGHTIYYRDDQRMMAVEIHTEPSLSAGSPTMLFEGAYERDTSWKPRKYDLSPDGEKFVMIKSASGTDASMRLQIVLNWFEELKRLVPTGGSR